jgi:TrmH family RNA methyltransferase
MITSLTNPTIKSLRKLADRKERQESGLFLIEGLRIVAEALESQAPIESLVYAPDILSSEFGKSLVNIASTRSIPLVDVSPEVFISLSRRDGPQGIAAVVQQRWHNLVSITPQTKQTWVALESVQNPGNLGSVMRTAEAVGAAGVILLDQSTDPYDPSAVKASMGALFHLVVAKATFEEFKYWVRQHKVKVVGSSDKAEQDYLFTQYPDPCILLMGSEREGLNKDYLALCETVVRIPMIGSSDSLNLAIATSIILYQIFNQKRTHQKLTKGE